MLAKIKTNLIPPQDDPDEIRRRGLVRILTLGLLVRSVIAFVVVIAYLLITPGGWSLQDNQLALASAFIAIIASTGIYQLNKRSSRVSSFLLLVLLVTVSIFSDTPD